MKEKRLYMKITKRGEWILKHPYALNDNGNFKWWAKLFFWFKENLIYVISCIIGILIGVILAYVIRYFFL